MRDQCSGTPCLDGVDTWGRTGPEAFADKDDSRLGLHSCQRRSEPRAVKGPKPIVLRGSRIFQPLELPYSVHDLQEGWSPVDYKARASDYEVEPSDVCDGRPSEYDLQPRAARSVSHVTDPTVGKECGLAAVGAVRVSA